VKNNRYRASPRGGSTFDATGPPLPERGQPESFVFCHPRATSGIQSILGGRPANDDWIPAFAGMTNGKRMRMSAFETTEFFVKLAFTVRLSMYHRSAKVETHVSVRSASCRNASSNGSPLSCILSHSWGRGTHQPSETPLLYPLPVGGEGWIRPLPCQGEGRERALGVFKNRSLLFFPCSDRCWCWHWLSAYWCSRSHWRSRLQEAMPRLPGFARLGEASPRRPRRRW